MYLWLSGRHDKAREYVDRMLKVAPGDKEVRMKSTLFLVELSCMLITMFFHGCCHHRLTIVAMATNEIHNGTSTVNPYIHMHDTYTCIKLLCLISAGPYTAWMDRSDMWLGDLYEEIHQVL